jgi:hypothetical protein
MSNVPETRSSSAETNRVPGRIIHFQSQPVIVTDFQMPFGSMVVFMVKWVIAAIPAMIILFVIFAILGALVGGFFTSLIRT